LEQDPLLEGPCDDSDLVPEAVFLRFPHLALKPPPPPPPPPLPPPPPAPTYHQSGHRPEMNSYYQTADDGPLGGAAAYSSMFISARDSLRDTSVRGNEADRGNETDRAPQPNKRKFNCPAPNGQDAKQPPSGPSSNRGRGYASAPSSSNGNGNARQPASEPSEEELPEKLRGCDPKLIAMIENEILDRCGVGGVGGGGGGGLTNPDVSSPQCNRLRDHLSCGIRFTVANRLRFRT
jgi:hypothetical protein